jgi:hypothetical protein
MEGQPFTPEEALEYQCLKSFLFNGNMFVVFTPEEENSKEYKRYDELNKKKLTYLSSIKTQQRWQSESEQTVK